MNARLEQSLSFVLTLATLVVAGVMVHREFLGGAVQGAPVTKAEPPIREPLWDRLRAKSTAVGDTGAAVEIIVFTDFECPACRLLHRRLGKVREQMPSSLSLRMIHYPLEMHRFAYPAARAADCAARQGRLASIYELLFEKQDSLGLKSWMSFAADAGVTDTALFGRCVESRSSVSSVESGRAIGKQLAIRGTPTVIVNGWRFQSPPDEQELLRVVGAIRAGQRPFE